MRAGELFHDTALCKFTFYFLSFFLTCLLTYLLTISECCRLNPLSTAWLRTAWHGDKRACHDSWRTAAAVRTCHPRLWTVGVWCTDCWWHRNCGIIYLWLLLSIKINVRTTYLNYCLMAMILRRWLTLFVNIFVPLVKIFRLNLIPMITMLLLHIYLHLLRSMFCIPVTNDEIFRIIYI